jgi:hypothetical protein
LRSWTAYSGCGMTRRRHGSEQVCTGHPELFSPVIRSNRWTVQPSNRSLKDRAWAQAYDSLQTARMNNPMQFDVAVEAN